MIFFNPFTDIFYISFCRCFSAERQVGLLENGDSFAASNTEYPTL
jgi:hypothetical protein